MKCLQSSQEKYLSLEPTAKRSRRTSIFEFRSQI